jgi:hypothetical protein
MDVRYGRDRVGALADGADNRSLGDLVAADHARRAELEQGDGVAVGGLDSDRAAAAGNGAGEGDRSARGRPDPGTNGRADVDATVLAAGVDIVAERERPQDLPVGRPRPGRSGRRDDERRQSDRGNEHSPHGKPPSVVVEGNSRPR